MNECVQGVKVFMSRLTVFLMRDKLQRHMPLAVPHIHIKAKGFIVKLVFVQGKY